MSQVRVPSQSKGSPGRERVDIALDDDEDGAAGAGIAIDDDDAPGASIALDGDGGPGAGIGIDTGADPHPSPGAGFFGDPMKLTPEEAQRISEGSLGTAEVLSVGVEALVSNRSCNAAVVKQIDLFLKRLAAWEQKSTPLKLAPNNHPGYRRWLDKVRKIRSSSTPASGLRALIDDEQQQLGMSELWTHAQVHLGDLVLEVAEHRKMLDQAERLGLTPADVEETYQRFIREVGPIERQTPQAAAIDAKHGWPPHKKLTIAGGPVRWDLGCLQGTLLQSFDAGVEIANLASENRFSLEGYLAERDEPKLAQDAAQARQLASDVGCPPLAVWSFLWSTGRPDLHIGGNKNRPAALQRRRIGTLEKLLILVRVDWVIDDLRSLLENGLFETWLSLAVHDELKETGCTDAVALAKKLRKQAAATPNSKRPDFLRFAVLQLLWALGFEGLPLKDTSGKPVVVKTLNELVASSVPCWESLKWCLHHEALPTWLDKIDASEAKRVRECIKLSA